MNKSAKLLVQHQPGAADEELEYTWMEGADAFIIDPCDCDVETVNAIPVDEMMIISSDPGNTLHLQQDKTCRWVCDEGLQKTAELRDEWKESEWIPKLTVFRPHTSYRFSGPAIGEGFSFYIPDTSTIRGWRVTDGDILLSEAVQKARALGFTSVWLHSLDAENEAKGLELEMLDRTEGSELNVWLSGGISNPQHLKNMVRVGGASAAVVDSEFARTYGIAALNEALLPVAAEPVTAEVNFVCGQGCSPAV